MSKPNKIYRILYADKMEALAKGGIVFNNQMEADDYIKKASEESPRFHYWVEPMERIVDALVTRVGAKKTNNE